jgi:hypothetical protein
VLGGKMMVMVQAFSHRPLWRHCQLIEKIPNKWVKHLTTDLLTPCILVHECQGKSQEIGYLSLS